MDTRKESAEFQTSEKVKIEYELAAIPLRIGAFLIDYAIQMLIFFILYIVIVFSFTGSLIVFDALDNDRGSLISFIIPGLLLLVTVLFLIFYRLLFEIIWKGQTPGKRITHIRVIHDDGTYINVFSAVLRNLFMIVDSLPVSYAIGITTMFINKKNKRLGDLVAGTIVVVERKPELPKFDTLQNVDLFVRVTDIKGLFSEKEFQSIGLYCKSKNDLDIGARRMIERRLADLITERTSIECPGETSLEAFVFALYYSCK